MIRFVEWFIWLVILAALSVGGYTGYQIMSERRSSSTQDPQYTNSSMENWEDTSYKSDITPTRIPITLLGKENRYCPKVEEMTLPGNSDKIYNIMFAHNTEMEEDCLKKGPILLGGEDDSRLAVPGEPGLAVVSGHRDTQFEDMETVEKGDYVILNDQRTKRTFQVRRYRTIPKDEATVEPVTNTTKSLLWISTCYPFKFHGPAPYRRIYELEMVREESGVPWHNSNEDH
ncbi:sortase domain-containing protein [Pasteuria penetrans]|uniref:sortase domain-containing protein n=1 Tax=Pasteuria penetrans TaxID=86005 RepID=UPI000FBA1A81|nr:sortase [Pasteuria penetrans]